MNKNLVIPLLVPVIAFGAVKGIYWYQVKTFADEMAARAAPFMTLEYDGIETGLDGAAGIAGVRIYPVGGEEPVRVGSIRVVSDDWTYFLRLNTPFDSGELPNQLRFEINGIDFDLNSALAKQLGSMGSNLQPPMAGCEAAGSDGIDLFRTLGYSSLLSDISLAYNYSPASEYLTATMEMSTFSSFSMKLSADIDMGVSSLNRSSVRAAQPKLGGVTIQYNDDSFNSRLLEHCASLTGESTGAFTERHVETVAERYRQLGFVFDNSLTDAYRRFLSGKGNATLKLAAENPVGVQEAAIRTPDQILRALSKQLQVNGKVIYPLNIGWQQPELTEQLVAVTESGTAEPQVERSSEISEPVVQSQRSAAVALLPAEPEEAVLPELRYRVTETAGLSAYIGSKAQVYTFNGHSMEGTILEVRRNRLQLEQRIGTGIAELPIAFVHIAEIRVLR